MTKPHAKVLATMLVLSSFAASTRADDAKSKKTDLEGTWQAVGKDGHVQRMKFTGNKFEATIHGKLYKGTFKLNNDENPLEIDIKITQTPVERHKGKTALGIYEFQGEHLRWCSSQPGRKRRPSQFAAVMGDARLLLAKLKKAK